MVILCDGEAEEIGLTEFAIFGYSGHGEGLFRKVVFVQVYGVKE